ncbi:hypothetical protein [Consotaella salsifontis]|uniref:hypothetical protein n=1 Tax=Consotaella salsifontis TaxID=1365950 RepID=UPI001A95C9F3
MESSSDSAELHPALASDIPLLANLGGAQLAAGFGLDEARRAFDMIDADALIVHLNPLQEAVQPEGDRNWRGVLDRLQRLIADLECPVAVKEISAGISKEVDDAIWLVSFMSYDLGYIDLEQKTLQTIDNPHLARGCHLCLTYVLLPMSPGRTEKAGRSGRI